MFDHLLQLLVDVGIIGQQRYKPLVVFFSVKFFKKPRFICSGLFELLDSPLAVVEHTPDFLPPKSSQASSRRYCVDLKGQMEKTLKCSQ